MYQITWVIWRNKESHIYTSYDGPLGKPKKQLPSKPPVSSILTFLGQVGECSTVRVPFFCLGVDLQVSKPRKESKLFQFRGNLVLLFYLQLFLLETHYHCVPASITTIPRPQTSWIMRSQACVSSLRSLSHSLTSMQEAEKPRILKENFVPFLLGSELLHTNAEARTKL